MVGCAQCLFESDQRSAVNGTVESSTQVLCTTPQHEPGTVHVQVQDELGQLYKGRAVYVYYAVPQVSRLDPSEGCASATDTVLVTVHGSGLYGACS